MAERSLAVSVCSSNPVLKIICLMDAALQEACNIASNDDGCYFQELATLIGLGFTAVLAEGSQIRFCRPYLVTFLRYQSCLGNNKKREQLCIALVEMAAHALQAFKKLGYPKYYDDFILALFNALNFRNTESQKLKEDVSNTVKAFIMEN